MATQIWIKAAGCLKNMELGTLYNRRNDEALPNSNMWSNSAVDACVVVSKCPEQQLQLSAENDNIVEFTSRFFGLDDSLNLSVQLGMISKDITEPDAAIQFLNKIKEATPLQLKCLRFIYTSHSSQLDLEKLPDDRQTISMDDSATHVITGVVYGFETIFYFEDTECLSEKAKSLCPVPVDDSSFDLTRISVPSELDEKQCWIFRDFEPFESKSMFGEALDIERKFLLSGFEQNGNKLVPKFLLITDISTLSTCRLQFPIPYTEETMLLRTCIFKTIDSSYNILRKCKSLLKACIYDQQRKATLIVFHDFCLKYFDLLRKDLQSIVVRNRTKEKMRNNEMDFLNTIEDSIRKLLHWLEENDKIAIFMLNKIKELKEFFPDISISESENPAAKPSLSFEVDSVSCENDPLIILMSQCSIDTLLKLSRSISDCCTNQVKMADEVKGIIELNASLFTSIMKCNHENKALTFAINLGVNNISTADCARVVLHFDDQAGQPREVHLRQIELNHDPSSITHASIALSWTDSFTTYSKDIEKLIIYYCKNVNGTKPSVLEVPKTNKTCTLENLHPNTEYSIRINACVVGGLLLQLTHETILTTNKELPQSEHLTDLAIASTITEEKPLHLISGKPGRPTMVATSHNSITVQFDEPKEEAQAVIHYDVMYCLENGPDDDEWQHKLTDGKVESIVIDNLTPETEYQFKVRAYRNGGYSGESRAKTFKTTKAMPGPPGTPTYSKSTSETISLSWSSPKILPELVNKYIICYCIESESSVPNSWNNKFETQGNVLSAEIPDLKPDTSYLFKVKAECVDGMSSSFGEISQPIQTESIIISSPRQVQIMEVTDVHVIIKWEEPEKYTSFLTNYEITYHPMNQNSDSCTSITVDGKETSVTVSHLQPETNYKFVIKPMSTLGYDSQNEVLIVNTKQSCLSSPVNLTTTDVRNEESVTSDPITTEEPKASHAPSKLPIKKEEPASDIISGKPGKPVKVNKCHNSITIEFDEPKKEATAVIHYDVMYYRQDDNDDDDDDDDDDEWQHKCTKGKVESIVIDNLTPDTRYQFKVRAYCKGGFSNESNTKTIKTTKAMAGPPGTPTYSKSTSETISLSWSAPQILPELVNKYIICYCIESESSVPNSWNNKFETQGNVLDAEIPDLRPDTSYLFKVKAECVDGMFSPFSEISQSIQTESIIISSPRQVHVVEVTDVHVIIKWEEPEKYASFLANYEITYHLMDQNSDSCTSITVDGKETSVTVSHLQPETNYKFVIKPVSSLGYESQNEVLTVNTKQSCLSSPKNPTTIDVRNEESVTSDPITTEEPKASHAPSKLPIKKEEPASDIISGKPGKPVKVNKCHNSITIEFDEPKKEATAVIHYDVMYYRQDDNDDDNDDDDDDDDEWQHKCTKGKVESIVIDNLTPDTRYQFKVRAYCKGGFSNESITKTIKTTKAMAGPPGTPTYSKSTYKTISLCWSAPQILPELVNKYIVCYCIESESSVPNSWNNKFETQGNVLDAEIPDLRPDTSYLFKVKAECGDGMSNPFSEISQSIQTESITISSPSQVHVLKQSDDHITLKWDKPDLHSIFVTKYMVEFHRIGKEDCHSICTENNETCCATIPNLAPKTNYGFVITPIASAGFNVNKSEEFVTSTQQAIPGIPQNLSIKKSDCSSVTLQWDKPLKNPNLVASYSSQYCLLDGHGNIEKRVSHQCRINQSIVIKSLEPGRCYSFRVFAHCSNGMQSTKSNECMIELPFPIPEKPGIPKVVQRSHDSILVKWKRSSSNPGVVKKYMVKYKVHIAPDHTWTPVSNGGVSVDKDHMQALVSDLTPKTQYNFLIEAVNKSGQTTASKMSDTIKTLPLPCKPGKPQGNPNSHDEISVTWDRPKHYDSITGYGLMYGILNQRQRPTNWKQKEVQIDNRVKKPYCTLNSLAPDTQYIIKVFARTIDGNSDESDISDPVRTEKLEIFSPRKLQASDVSYNQVALSWTKPLTNWQYVSGYEVKYHSVDSKTAIHETVTTQSANETCITIGHLSSETKYSFKVVAVSLETKNCLESQELFMKTQEAVCSPPRNLRIKDYNHESVTLLLNEPLSNPELVDDYMVLYSCNNDVHWICYQKEFQSTEIHLTSLLPQVKYSFKVLSICRNNNKVSEHSNHTGIELPAPIPGKPGKPISESVSDDTITLQWSKPQLYPEFVQLYYVYYLKVDKSQNYQLAAKHHVKDEDEHLSIQGLDPKTKYKFVVKAESITGVGEPSEPSDEIVTLAPIPSKPEKPVSIKVAHNEIGITWKKPEKHSARVSNYIVYYAIKSTNDEQSNWSEKTTHDQESVCTISNLVPGTKYIFKVVARSKDGDSDASNESDVISTSLPIPSRPGKPECFNKEHDWIELKWEKPQQFAENVKYYEVTCIQDGNLKQINTDDSNESIKFVDLDPQQSYRFQVRANSDFGWSEKSRQSDEIGTESQRLAIKILPSCDPIEMSESEKKLCPPVHSLKMEETYKLTGQKIAGYQNKKPSEQSIRNKTKVLLIVGATGTGKTTLINAMINYLYGVEWKDDFRLKLIIEKVKSQARSVTKWITSYTFYHSGEEGFRFPYNLTIIDTPGFGDTEGIQQDKQITSQIKHFFSIKDEMREHGIDHLDGVGFVVKASETRLTSLQKYVFNSILSMFGEDMKDKFFLMMTFADGGRAPVLDAVKEAEIEYVEAFKFNNSALYSKHNEEANDQEFCRMYWELGITSFTSFFGKFKNTSAVSLELSREVLQKREHLEVVICSLQKQIKIGMADVDNLKNHMKVLEEKKKDIKDNKKFTYETPEATIVEIKLTDGEHVTNCLDCNMTCHYPCLIKDDGKKYYCGAMGFPRDENTKCKICPKKCSWERHRNLKYRLEVQKKMVTKTADETKARYDTAVKGESLYDNIVKNMEKELQNIFTEILKLIKQAHACTALLDKIALKRHPLNDLSYIDLLIDGENIEQSEGYVARIRYYKEVREQAKLIDAAGRGTIDNYSDKGAKDWWKTFLDTENELPQAILPSSGVVKNLKKK